MENENRYIQTYIIFLKLVYLYLFLQKNSSTWDERDVAYSPVDCSETEGTPYDLLEVFIIQKGRRNEWSYDARGNRIDSTVDNNSLVIEYYENSDLLKKYGEWYFNYDANGNMTSRGKNCTETMASNELFEGYVFSSDTGELWTYEYDLSNRLVKVNYSGCGTNGLKEKAEYLYDYRGLCIAKTSGNETEYHEYTADGRLIYTERSDYVADYVYSGTSIFAEVRKQNGNDETFYHHTDHLGTTEVITDESGTVVWKASYEAFGSVLCENGTRVFEASFTGKFFDKDIGLYYFNARWYDAETGKFVSSDPIRDGVNWWNYCNGNPISLVDPTGLTEEIPYWNIRAKWEGTKVHIKAEAFLFSLYGGQCEYGIPEGGMKDGSDGRADYVLGNEVYEIKPITQQAKSSGKEQLQKYVDNIDIPNAKKGTSLLNELKGKSIGEVTTQIPGVCNYTKSYHLITFPEDPSQAGMIYYKESKKLDFEPLKETVKKTSEAVGKGIMYAGAVLGLAIGSLVLN